MSSYWLNYNTIYVTYVKILNTNVQFSKNSGHKENLSMSTTQYKKKKKAFIYREKV